MKFSRIEDELESLQTCKGFDSRLGFFLKNLPEEIRNKIQKTHDYFMENGIIADAFTASGNPVNIL